MNSIEGLETLNVLEIPSVKIQKQDLNFKQLILVLDTELQIFILGSLADGVLSRGAGANV